MKKILRFVKRYYIFSLALLAVIVGGVLYLLKYKTAANWILGTVSILATLPYIYSMYNDLRMGKFGIDILAVTSIVASVLLHQYWAGIIVVLMLSGGESLEDYAEHQAQRELDSLLSNAPVSATVLKKGKEVTVPVDEINRGDKILIKAGEVVAVDAEIIEGQANFNEASITGESLPVFKSVKANIVSGSISVDGVVTAKALATAEDSQYQQIIRLVKSASASQTPFVRLADRYSLPFTITAYAIASCVWLISGQAIRFLEVIIVATPCPLILAAPIALISGMARSSRYGVIVKNGKSMERLANAATIAFDKTGTLTIGELKVNKVQSFGNYKNDDIVILAASVDQNSNHVIAEAITKYARSKNYRLQKAKQLEEVAGMGVKASVKGQTILVGSNLLMKREDIKLPETVNRSDFKDTSCFVAVDGKLVGILSLNDEIRPETKATIDFFHASGIKNIAMITGDNQAAADSIANQLGIDNVHAEALPADKLHILSKFKNRPVVFVGDGVNDAPVLSASDVGIALGAEGSTAASESADMVVMLNDISRVAVGYEIAKKTFRIAEQSILIGIVISLGLMALFATGKFPPVLGALLQEVVDVFVIFNALRAHNIKPSMVENKSNS